MIRVRQVKVSINNLDNLESIVASKLKINREDILKIKIVKESIDARKKNDIYFVYEVDVLVNDEKILNKLHDKDIFPSPNEEYYFCPKGNEKINNQIVVVGSGPAGLFASFMLASFGYKPLIIERGKEIEKRVQDVEKFFSTGKLNPESNVQFGEGGAGCFSDGKLNTMIKDKFHYGTKVFEIFVENGASDEILYKNKPHIGTDHLRRIIVNMRKKIESMGGTFRYNTKLTNIFIENNKIKEIEVNNKERIKTDVLVLAIGHSARDTFAMLNKYLKIIPKPFAVGIRIEHKQEMIDKSQYGGVNKLLGPSSYKLTYTSKNNRGVYTFCMCPGGFVINSSSEENGLVINGMSNHLRDSENANSAIIVTVTPDDFGNNPLDGIVYQKKLEEKAYELGKGKIPIQLYKDFKNNVDSTEFGNIKPLFKGDYTFVNINNILPDYISSSIKEGIEEFDKKINGFADGNAIIAAIESRTSSPVRILRNDNYYTDIEGIYPCGEGSGYAGGITSSAIDGIKVSEAIMNKYKN